MTRVEYQTTGSILLPVEVEVAAPIEPTFVERAVATAILQEFGGPMLVEANVGRAKKFITAAIATNPGLGGGCGPVNHHATTD